MGNLSNYAEPKLLDQVLGGTAWTPPATVYVALYTIIPTGANASGTEVSGGSYARVAVTNNATNWPAATGTQPASKSNGTAITFPAPTANWGTVVGFAIYDAAASGNEIGWGSLTSNQTINSGDGAPVFGVGALVCTLQ